MLLLENEYEFIKLKKRVLELETTLEELKAIREEINTRIYDMENKHV